MTIALDKRAHFLGGIAIAALAMPFGTGLAVLAAVVIGGAKEVIYDRYFGGTVDPEDFAWTLAGAAAFLAWMRFATFLMER
jgi:hypothetical protein